MTAEGMAAASRAVGRNDMDHYADLAELIEHLNLSNVILFGFSTGGGEVARYIARHGTSHISQDRLICAVTPLMLKTPSNPQGTPDRSF